MFIQCLLKHVLDLFINQPLKNTDWALPVWRVMGQSWGLKVERKVWPSRIDNRYQLQQNKVRFWVGRCVCCLRVRAATCQGNIKGTKKTPGKSDRGKDAQTPGESGRERKQSSRWGKQKAARETRGKVCWGREVAQNGWRVPCQWENDCFKDVLGCGLLNWNWWL